MLDDPDAVAAALDEEDAQDEDEAPQTWHPESASWTSLHEMMAHVIDRLGSLAALTADLPTGVKKRHEHPPPYARPVTELSRQRKERADAKAQEYDDRLMDQVEAAKARWRAQHPDAPPVMRRGA